MSAWLLLKHVNRARARILDSDRNQKAAYHQYPKTIYAKAVYASQERGVVLASAD
jgi:hypothetical protein